MPSNEAPSVDAPPPLVTALGQSREVKAKVEECVEDINTANGLLVEARIAGGATTTAAAKALVAGFEVESKVQECADDLHDVTVTLAKGVEGLRETETALLASQKALSETRAALVIAKEGEREARLQALHDSTTGLPNRDLFDSRLEQAISMAKRQGWTLAVMFFDLDRFKAINDTYGHAAGDVVLLEVAKRLQQHAREEDTVCRNGGDEFLYLLVNPQGRQNIERIARSVAERVAQRVAWKDETLAVAASIGIAVYPQDGSSGEDLIRSADSAMYLAKKRRSGHAFADAEPAPDRAHPSESGAHPIG
ncbi:MAG: GGDEF domain-containing protein [Pseudomonadota bacterium]|nr:GGDEF domain-containing protein [Pseudomonadota bacterium]